ncbi:hypothetical protein BG004_001028, partial [Podila humilis]
PSSLAQPRVHSIQQSMLLILQHKNRKFFPTSSSSSSATSSPISNSKSASRSKYPFGSTTSVFRKLTAKDLSVLNSQEIVRLAIYVMKRSNLDFADPFTSEKVHTTGEEYNKRRQHDISKSSAAAEIYLSRKFNIGVCVLHNPAYPLQQPLASAITIATFCAKASGGLRSKSTLTSTTSSLQASYSSSLTPPAIAGAKWLAKLGQIIFGGPCSHAGHPHHRRTRASLELLERQNIELGKQILTEEQKSKTSSNDGGTRLLRLNTSPSGTGTPSTKKAGKQSHSPTSGFYPLTSSEISAAAAANQKEYNVSLSRSISASTLSVPSSASTVDKWCKHCSRAVACLVLVAQQEASKSTGEEEEYIIADSGFGIYSAFDFLDDQPPSSSTTSSPTMPHYDFRPRLLSKSDELDITNSLANSASEYTSPYIIFDRSHLQQQGREEGIFQPHSPPDQSSNTSPSQQRKTGKLETSIADAFGSEFASDSQEDDQTKSSPHPILRRLNVANRNNGRPHSSPSSLGSDVELLSRVSSPLSTSGRSPERIIPASQRGQSDASPYMSYSPPKSLLERDLAEALATNAPRLPFTASSNKAAPIATDIITTPFARRLSTSDLGLQPKPTLESVHEIISRSNSERSVTVSSAQSSCEGSHDDDAEDEEQKQMEDEDPLQSSAQLPVAITQGDSERSMESLVQSRDDDTDTTGKENDSIATGSHNDDELSENREKASEYEDNAYTLYSRSPSPTPSSSPTPLPSSSPLLSLKDDDNQEEVEPSPENSTPMEASLSSTYPTTETQSSHAASPLSLSASLSFTKSDPMVSSQNETTAASDINNYFDNLHHHRTFYALGIHGQTPTDAYATEIEEVIQRGPKKTYTPVIPGEDIDEIYNNLSDRRLGNEFEETSNHSHSSEGSPIHSDTSGNDGGNEQEEEDEEEVEEEEVEVEHHKNEEKKEKDGKQERDQESHPSEKEKVVSSEAMGSPKSPISRGSHLGRPESSIPTSTRGSSLLTDETYLSLSSGNNDSDDDLEANVNDDDDDDDDDNHQHHPSSPGLEGIGYSPYSSSSSFSLPASPTTTTTTTATTTTTTTAATSQKEQNRLLRRHRHRRRQQLVDDQKRKQEQLERIKAQLELKALGKIRQQVSFWEEKGVLEQRVVSVEEV